MVAVPGAMPLTVPVAETVAVPVLLLLHVPPDVVSASDNVVPAHTTPDDGEMPRAGDYCNCFGYSTTAYAVGYSHRACAHPGNCACRADGGYSRIAAAPRTCRCPVCKGYC